MKTRKLLAKLANFMDKDRNVESDELAAIREVLKKLKTKEHKLREKLEANPDEEERKELQGKLDVVHAQRIKGLERVMEIRDSRKEISAPAAATEAQATEE
jgi:predicted metal-dependent enzyme (double-stranded beta helix superfamily)